MVVLHLPVVLHVAFDVVVDVLTLDAFRALRIRAEAADRRIREAERGVARVRADRVLLEVQARAASRASLHLLLVAVLAVEPGLDRMPAEHLRQADRDVEARGLILAGEPDVGRRVRDAISPREARWQQDPRAVPHRRPASVQERVDEVPIVDQIRLGEDERNVAEADVVAVRIRRHRECVAELRTAAAADAKAATLISGAMAGRAFEEERGRQRVVDRRGDERNVRTHHLCVVPAGNRPLLQLCALRES